jgi:hypothetical protein
MGYTTYSIKMGRQAAGVNGKPVDLLDTPSGLRPAGLRPIHSSPTRGGGFLEMV